MLSNKRTWLVALVLVLLVGGGAVALQRTVLDEPDRAGGKKGKVEVDLAPDAKQVKNEPKDTRVYVDNAGRTVSVSVRTPSAPWATSLEVDVNGRSTTLERGGQPTGQCGPRVKADPVSLITRLDYDRRCIDDSATVTATVSVDGGEAVTAEAKQTERPNVLMLMVDDMRADELQWMPNVQKLIADQGVDFTNGFASFPLCCPARASVMTGNYPHNHQVWSHEPPWGFSSLQDEDTYPVWMQRTGYYTTYLGKYLNGYGSSPEPGKDTGNSTQYCPPGWDNWRASVDGGMDPDDPQDGGTYRFYDTTLNNNCDGYLPLNPTYQTTAYADLGAEQVSANAEQGEPWMSYISFTAPHHGGPAEEDDPDYMVTPARPRRIWGVFDEYIKKAPGVDWKDPDRSDKPTRITKSPPTADLRAQMLEAARQRAESLYLVDLAVKKIITRLRETGQLDNTVIAFTSDNGYFLGEQGERQGKILPYEPSLRVPLVMRGPGIPKGEVRTDPFLSIDYGPTFADFGDSKHGVVDGESLVDVARLGDTSNGKLFNRVVLTETKPTDAVQLKLLQKDPVGARTDEMLQAKTTGIRTGRFLYTEWLVEPGDKNPGATVELYDNLEDPNQYKNLAEDPEYADIVATLHDVLVAARTCVGQECKVNLPASLR